MDTKTRDGLMQEQNHVLGWLAGLVIRHLETNREAMEGRRSKLMSNALNVFVDGRSRTTKLSDHSRTRSAQPPGGSREWVLSKRSSRTYLGERKPATLLNGKETTAEPLDQNSDVEESSGDRPASTRDRTTTSSDPSSDEEDFGDSRQHEAGSEGHRYTFGRAANILRECFELEGSDGVVFLEAGKGLNQNTASGRDKNSQQQLEGPAEEGSTSAGNIADSETPTSPTHHVGTNSSFDPLLNAFAKHAKDPARVLASSAKNEPFLQGDYPAGRPALGDIDQDVLRELFKRYPQGKIWVLDNGTLASSSEDDWTGNNSKRTSSQRRKRSQHRKGEVSIMSRIFPEVRQVLFVPLWDAGNSSWSCGCFLYSTSESRVYSTATDIGFLSAFGKTIMAECSRLDTLLADKQKADFIGSISHELRSPLHGILAGAEFLNETVTSAFQKSLLDTIEACGRTLLDVISNVLDFSKINSLDRNWRNNRQPRRRLVDGQIGPGAQMSAKQLPIGALPLLHMYAVTDIAAITEEVVEGLSVGQIYFHATDLTDVSAGNRGRGANKGMRSVNGTHGGRKDGTQAERDPLEVVLDIANEDWVFMAQPGSLRRIILNLLGK
jgi:His Kinase A (phospho-acceptor) domain